MTMTPHRIDNDTPHRIARRPLRAAAIATSAVALTAAGIACHEAHEVPEPEALPTATVSVVSASPERSVGREEAVGTVRPRLRATLEAKVSGRITEMRKEPGEEVRKGEVVAVLDVREIRAKLNQARARFEQAEAERERYTNLLEKDAVTRQEFESIETRYEVAKAGLEEARSILDHARVTAPFDGVVTHKLANEGDLASPGRPIYEVADPSSLRLEVAVPEALSGFVGIGAQIPVRIASATEPVDATVSEIAPAADPNSRTLLVKLDLPDIDGLRSGQFGRALIPTGRTEILRLPEDAVVRRGQLEIVFVADDGHARLRLVKTGKRFGDRVEIVSGLEPGERVVVDGAENLLDGQPIEVTEVRS
jgi:RND family efflux transporter MFP subunit